VVGNTAQILLEICAGFSVVKEFWKSVKIWRSYQYHHWFRRSGFMGHDV